MNTRSVLVTEPSCAGWPRQVVAPKAAVATSHTIVSRVIAA